MAHPHIGLLLLENFLTCIFLGAELGVMDQFVASALILYYAT
jgi:hypothetical protein